jgi:transcriptional regulator with XRE-family HTH domain
VANDVLRRALSSAKLTERQLAERVAVDPATVSRWVSDEFRVPQQRLRWRVAEILGTDETMLWPQAARAAIKMGADREIQAVYPTRSAMPREVWQRLVADATKDLIFCGWSCYFLWAEVPDLSRLLRRKAESGVRVRFVLGDSDSPLTRRSEEVEGTGPLPLSARIGHTRHELEPLRDVVQVRQSDLGWGKGVWRGDGQAVASWNVIGRLGHESPVLHLVRRMDGGIFDQVAVRHAEALWEAGRPVWE